MCSLDSLSLSIYSGLFYLAYSTRTSQRYVPMDQVDAPCPHLEITGHALVTTFSYLAH